MRRPAVRVAAALRQDSFMVILGDDAGGGTSVEALLIAAHEAERTEIARRLHGDIGQRMAVLTMDLDALCRALPVDAEEARARVREVSDRTIELAKDIQSLSHRLYPAKLEYIGLVSAAADFCRDVSRRQHVEVAFGHDAVPDGVPMNVALSLFRVLQEAVNNAVTHAGVDHLTVTLLGSTDEIRLEIVDAGGGFDPEEALD